MPPCVTQHAAICVSPTRSSTAVIVLGDVLTAPWRFTVDAAGQLDLGALGLSAHAHRLSP